MLVGTVQGMHSVRAGNELYRACKGGHVYTYVQCTEHDRFRVLLYPVLAFLLLRPEGPPSPCP